MKKALVCSVCGYIHLQDNSPEKCPICGASSKSFNLKDDILKTKDDIVTVGESHKKHLPIIFSKIMQCCSSSEGQCQEIKAKIGELVHPMIQEHYITRIIFYADNNYIAHFNLTPNLKPIGSISLDVKDKKISVIAQCNIHGSWITNI